MAIIYQNALTDLGKLRVQGPGAEVVEWQGRQALKLNGLALLPDLSLIEGHLEVLAGADGTAYPGLAFRAQDVLNYELAYAQPHTSGKWDALQYDPVFHGSNTWQLYSGPAFQQRAGVPLAQWFRLSIDFKEQRASVSIGHQAPLMVHRLARPEAGGLAGVWSYLPAYFCDLRVGTDMETLPTRPLTPPAEIPPAAVTEWFLEGYGQVTCEPHGVLNLNRCLAASAGEVRLSRWLETEAPDTLELKFGFSDKLTLRLDDATLFEGENTWKDTPYRQDRGYVEPTCEARQALSPGRHRLTACLSATEPFGWGLVLSLTAPQTRLLPAIS